MRVTIIGPEGRRRIESARAGHELLDFVFGFEENHAQRHLRELDAGHAVVVVEAENESIAERASEALAAHGGHFINYYSRWTGRSLVP